MWILTIVLLLANGDIQVLTTPVDRTITGARCHAKAHDTWQINRIGVHVLSATCDRAKEA